MAISDPSLKRREANKMNGSPNTNKHHFLQEISCSLLSSSHLHCVNREELQQAQDTIHSTFKTSWIPTIDIFLHSLFSIYFLKDIFTIFQELYLVMTFMFLIYSLSFVYFTFVISSNILLKKILVN